MAGWGGCRWSSSCECFSSVLALNLFTDVVEWVFDSVVEDIATPQKSKRRRRITMFRGVAETVYG